MKPTFASTLAFLPILTIVSAFEVSDVYKKTLGNSDCSRISLTKGHILHATCINPGYGTLYDFNLDLNGCFANYLGTLNHVTNGGFAASCSSCHVSGTKLVCECSAGRGRGTKHNEVELADWNVIQVNDESLTCGSTAGIEKRAAGAQARFFVA
ncbi:hypothetical protein GGS26DRAFT_122021 [Hypomontagnella submonticulosa]|nr:hypothetical protein GGS26DRAFT_122021 [Hypomontagnella submonticulosa]